MRIVKVIFLFKFQLSGSQNRVISSLLYAFMIIIFRLEKIVLINFFSVQSLSIFILFYFFVYGISVIFYWNRKGFCCFVCCMENCFMSTFNGYTQRRAIIESHWMFSLHFLSVSPFLLILFALVQLSVANLFFWFFVVFFLRSLCFSLLLFCFVVFLLMKFVFREQSWNVQPTMKY